MKNSWKTMLAGFVAGGANLYANGSTGKQIILSLAIAGLGLLTKDFDKSNAPNPIPIAQAVPPTPNRH